MFGRRRSFYAFPPKRERRAELALLLGQFTEQWFFPAVSLVYGHRKVLAGAAHETNGQKVKEVNDFMLNRENAGRILRRLGLALIAAMVFIVLTGAGKVYADTKITSATTTLNGGTQDEPAVYYLDGDVTLESQGLLLESGYVTLNLNGHTLSLSDSLKPVSNQEPKRLAVINVETAQAHLTINGRAGTAGEMGKITGGEGNQVIHYHYTDYDTTYRLRGGGIALRSGTVTINDVEISGNTANYGGGVYLCEGATFTMNGSSLIQGNFVEKSLSNAHEGGAVFIDASTFNMNGGTITGNHSRGGGWSGVYAGEVDLNGNRTYVNISGNSVIFTNTPEEDSKKYENLLCGTNNATYGQFQVSMDNLGPNAKIGVDMETPGVFTTMNSETQQSDMTKLYSDKKDYVIIRTLDGKLELKNKAEISDFYSVVKDSPVEYDGKQHGVRIDFKQGVVADTYFGAEVGNLKKEDDHEYDGFTDAGKYTVFYQIVPASEYPWIVDSEVVEITQRDINKTDLTWGEDSAEQIDTIYYDGTVKAPVPTLKDRFDVEDAEGMVVDPEKEYTVTYKMKDEAGVYQEIGANEVVRAGEYQVIITSKEVNYTGEIVTDFEIALKQPGFRGRSLLLGGSIGLKVYMYLPQAEYLDYSESCMTFTVQHEDGSREPIPFTPDPDSADEVYSFICYVNSVQMADEIQAVFNYDYTGTLADMTAEPLSETFTVKEYIGDAMASEVESIKMVQPLIMSLADYGHYAQIYLSGIRPWSIPQDHEEMDVFFTDSYDEDAVKAAKTDLEAKDVSTLLSSRISKVTYSLYLDSDTAIFVYFKRASNYSGGAEATVNGVKTKVYLTSDKRFKVVIPDIPAHRLGSTYTISLKTGTLENTVTISAMSYVKAVLEQSTQEDEINTSMALYNYYKNALKYSA